MTPAVAVIGGGVAGLAATRRLVRRAREAGRPLDITLLEASDEPGGKVRTLHPAVSGLGPFVVEAGPDSFLTRKPEVLRIIEEEHLTPSLIPTRGGAHGSYVYSRGHPRRLPEGLVLMVPGRISSLLATDLLSPWGKARALADLVIPARRGGGDESLASFVKRRLGREVLERVAEPLIAGIHAAEPETMSLLASFPRMLEMEGKHGSLIRAALAGRRAHPPAPQVVDGVHLSYFMSLQNGMGDLARALVASVADADIQTGHVASSLVQVGERFEIGGKGWTVVADGVLIATPASVAAELLATVSPRSAAVLREMRSIGAATVSFAWRRGEIAQELLGHGFVIPREERRRIMGVTYSSLKWQGRSPDPDVVLLRAFVGGAHGQELIDAGGEAVRQTALDEVSALLGIRTDPLLAIASLWPGGMPQYYLGHLERVRSIEDTLRAEVPGVRLAGAAYHGIGVPDCIGSGERAADALWDHLEGPGIPRAN